MEEDILPQPSASTSAEKIEDFKYLFDDKGEVHPVSYTHLTLPTILLV